jgi:hypothetical protein
MAKASSSVSTAETASNSTMVNLPFMGKKPNGRTLCWKVEPTGDWLADNEIGEQYARMLLKLRTSRRPLLCLIVRDMIATGRYTGIEAGFLGTLGHNLLPTEMERALGRPL